MRSNKIRPIRDRLCEEQEWRCYWCNCRMIKENPQHGKLSGIAATLDHIRNNKGKTIKLVAACCSCNHMRERKVKSGKWKHWKGREKLKELKLVGE